MKKLQVIIYCHLLFLIAIALSPGVALSNGNQDTVTVNAFNEVSFKLIKDDPDSSRKLALEAIRLSKPIQYLKGLGDAYVRLGILEKDLGNYASAIQYYKQSLDYRTRLGDQDLIARVFSNIGIVFIKQSQYDSAAFYLLKALRIAESLNLPSARAMYSMNLGIAYEKNHDLDMALTYIRQGRKLYEELEDTSGLIKSIINEAAVYHAREQYNVSLSHFREALRLCEQTEDDFNKHIVIGDIAAIYVSMKMPDSAIVYLRRSIAYNLETGNKSAAAIDYSNLGINYAEVNRSDSAIYFLEKSLEMCRELGLIKLAARNTQELSEVYEKRGNLTRALQYHRMYLAYHDSVFNASKAEAIAEMQTKYESEKKEHEILLLNKDKEIQQQQLERKTFTQQILISGGVLLAIMAALFFNRFKLKKKIESQQALLNERKRISSELHDDLGAQLSTARMFLSKLKSDGGSANHHEIISSSLSLIDGSINDLRRIMDDLQASTLQERGLIAAIEELVNKINHLQDISFRLSHHGLEERLHPKTEHQLFRITQELINNTLKYAGAKHVTIDFMVRDQSVILNYEDDGKGFDGNTVKRGYGLTNIESRAASMGGSAVFDSRPGKGCITLIELPLLYANAKT